MGSGLEAKIPQYLYFVILTENTSPWRPEPLCHSEAEPKNLFVEILRYAQDDKLASDVSLPSN
jgi:hypothetical protein